MTWNKAAERMYGYRAEAVIGKNVSILLPPDRPNEVRDILKKLQHGEKIEHFQTTRRTKDGGILHVSLTVSPVRDANGNIIAASTIARDITQTKLAEEALRNSERLALAGRTAPAAAFSCLSIPKIPPVPRQPEPTRFLERVRGKTLLSRVRS